MTHHNKIRGIAGGQHFVQPPPNGLVVFEGEEGVEEEEVDGGVVVNAHSVVEPVVGHVPPFGNLRVFDLSIRRGVVSVISKDHLLEKGKWE